MTRDQTLQLYAASADGLQLEWERPQPPEVKGGIRAVMTHTELLMQGSDDTHVYNREDLSPLRSLPLTDDELLAVLPNGATAYGQERGRGQPCVRVSGSRNMRLLMPGSWGCISVCGGGGGNIAVTDTWTKKLRIFYQDGE